MTEQKRLTLTAPNLASRLPEILHQYFDLSKVAPYNKTLHLSIKHGFRLPENIIMALKNAQIDYAILPKNMTFQDLRLIVSDMDSTFITIECIDEIADKLGIKDKVSAITERAMRGELDFSASLRERVKLLKGLPENTLQSIYNDVLTLSSGAKELLQACQQYQVKFMLVSGGFTFFTEQLKRDYALDFAFANTLGIDENGLLSGTVEGEIVDAQAKAQLVQKVSKQLNIPINQVIAMGDGANDLAMFKVAGYSVAYHAKPKVQENADICINFGGLDTLLAFFPLTTN